MSKPSKALSPDLIAWLEEFRADRRLSLPRLAKEMSAPFWWEVLRRALAGLPVWELNHRYIVRWIEARRAADGKAVERAENFGAIGTKPKFAKES